MTRIPRSSAERRDQTPQLDGRYFRAFYGADGGSFGPVSAPIVAGTLSDFRVSVSAPPGEGNAWTFTVYTGTGSSGTATAVSCTISGDTQRSCTDTSTHTFDHADQMAVLAEETSGNPEGARVAFVADYTPS